MGRLDGNPRGIEEAVVGDRVNISTKEGKHWVAKVIMVIKDITYLITDDGISFAYYHKSKMVENFYDSSEYSAYIEELPENRLNRNIIEFLNHKKDDKKIEYILTLLSLHLNELSEEKKDKLMDSIWDIITDGARRIRKNAVL